jgi:hypothetical protein
MRQPVMVACAAPRFLFPSTLHHSQEMMSLMQQEELQPLDESHDPEARVHGGS